MGVRSYPGASLGSPFLRGGWTPLDLGSLLYAWWSAERTDLITMSGGLVSSWKDCAFGYEVTAAGSARPTWQALGFGTRPAILFDGVANVMRRELMTGLPQNATPYEEWYAANQLNVAALTSSTYLGSMGGTANNNSHSIVRAVASGVNRLRTVDSVGSTGNTVTEGTVDFSGRKVVRAIGTGATLNAEIGGTAATALASVPTIGTTRVTFGANNATTAASFGNNGHADRVITGILTAAQAAQLRAFLSRGI